jgi:hypothetical protein
MKRRRVEIRVSDHAVIRYLERGLDIDVDALRAHIAGLAQNAAELGATGLKLDRIRVVIEPDGREINGADRVVIPTILNRNMLWAIEDAHRKRQQRIRGKGDGA